MKKQPEISFRDIEPSPVVESKIQERIERLERYTDEIIGCRVVGEDIFVSRNPEDDHSHEDIYVSIRDAFDAAERQLKKYAEQRRGQVKRHGEELPVGTVSRLFEDEHYGFITPRTGSGHVYFHANALVDAAFDSLEVGTQVRFHEEEGDEGPQASTVHVLSDQETVPGS